MSALYHGLRVGDMATVNKKPLGRTVVNRAHPLSRGLVSFATLTERTGSDIKDSVDAGLIYTKQTPINWGQFQGVWAQGNRLSSGNSDYVTSNKQLFPASGPFSVFIKLHRNNLDATVGFWLFGQYTGGQAGRFLCGHSATEQIQISYNGTATTIGSAGEMPLTEWFTLCLTRLGSVYTAYINGRNIGSATVASTIYQGVGTSFLGSSLSGSHRGYCSHWCVYNRAINDAEVLALHRDNFAPLKTVFEPFYFVPSSAAVINLSTASETDSTIPLAIHKVLAVSSVSETSSALAASVNKTVALGEPSEVDSAFVPTIGKALLLAASSETDSLLTTIVNKAYSVSLSSETDTVQSLTVSKALSLGLASETDSALALVEFAGSVAIGIASEVDTCIAFSVYKFTSIGSTSEVDSSLAVAVSKSTATSTAAEANSVPGALALSKLVTLAVAAESNSALSILASRIATTSVASEADSVFSVASVSKALIISLASELDSAPTLEGQEEELRIVMHPLVYVGDELYMLRRT